MNEVVRKLSDSTVLKVMLIGVLIVLVLMVTNEKDLKECNNEAVELCAMDTITQMDFRNCVIQAMDNLEAE